MPLASGQSRAIKAQVNKGETGLSNRKWSYRRMKGRKGGTGGGSQNKRKTRHLEHVLSQMQPTKNTEDRKKGLGLKSGDCLGLYCHGLFSLPVALPYPSSIWPVPGHPRCSEQRRHRLVKKKMLLSHASMKGRVQYHDVWKQLS